MELLYKKGVLRKKGKNKLTYIQDTDTCLNMNSANRKAKNIVIS